MLDISNKTRNFYHIYTDISNFAVEICKLKIDIPNKTLEQKIRNIKRDDRNCNR